MKWIYLSGTVIFAAIGQLLIKWRVDLNGAIPATFSEKLRFYWGLLTDGYVITAFILAFFSALFWMAAVSKFELNLAYPLLIVSSLLLTVLSSTWLLHESISVYKAAGVVIILIGAVILIKFG